MAFPPLDRTLSTADGFEELEVTLCAENRLQIGAIAAKRLAEALPPIDQWKDSLQSVPGIKPQMYNVKRFAGSTFVPEVFCGETGLYELWRRESQKQPSERPAHVLYYSKARDLWLRGDWYGLRFLAQHSLGRSCPVAYDEASRRMAVPAQWRWPELYERVLVLASGCLPSYTSALCYSGIGTELLRALETKLGLEVERR